MTGEPIVAGTPGSSGKATAALALGIAGMFTWLLPIVGLPVSITALVFGIKNRHSARPGQAITGLVLASISLFLVVINAFLGILLALQHASR
jgi:hypothetical protein